MGQTSSSQPGVSNHRPWRLPGSMDATSNVPSRRTRPILRSRPASTYTTPSSLDTEPHPPQPFATFSRQISSQSIPNTAGRSGGDRHVSTRDDVFYEQHEHLPTTTTGDRNVRSTPITHITASPLPRRSRLSRLTSALVPQHPRDATRHGNTNFGQSVSIRAGLDEEADESSRHSSMFGSLNTPQLTSRWRERRDVSRTRHPLPFVIDRNRPEPDIRLHSQDHTMPNLGLPSDSDMRASESVTRPLTNRLSRARNSIISHLSLMRPVVRHGEDQTSREAHSQPTAVVHTDGSDFQLPPMSLSETNTNLNDAVLDTASRAPRSFEMSPVPEASESVESEVHEQAWYDRLHATNSRREGRRVTGILRRGSSRLARRDVDAPWLNMLNAAARAVAAQLSDNPDQSVTNVQSLGPNNQDGRLGRLSQVLQQAVNAHGVGDQQEYTEVGPSPDSLRIFRFVSRASESILSNEQSSIEGAGSVHTTEALPSSANHASDDQEGRNVTIVFVAIRPALPGEMLFTNARDQDTVIAQEPSADSLANLPSLVEDTDIAQLNTHGSLRLSSRRSRFPHMRRASHGNNSTASSMFPSTYDAQRHLRRFSYSHPNSGDVSPSTAGTNTPIPVSETPPGPAPPPSTPAEHAFSTESSQATTPSRRFSTVSSPHSPPQHDHNLSTAAALEDQAIPPQDRPFSSVQQRRRSNSESGWHRNLGLGAARRNGVVEPDAMDSEDAPAGGSRSWYIYVVGANLSQAHPSWTTPSLFSDNPSYEDMLMLSSLIGPAKPAVASSEDVANAKGVYRIRQSDDRLVASAVEGSGEITIEIGERCLVCLGEYQLDEEARQLAKCSHIFHRECIDEWLTTGRNSCPLCRAQGVEDSKDNEANDFAL